MMLIIVGCTNTNKNSNDPAKTENKNSSISSLETLVLKDYLILDMCYHDNKIIILYTAHGNIEIAPAKIVIVDAINYDVLYEMDSDNIFVSGEIITLDNGFYINQGSDIIVYDYTLKVLKQIDLYQLQQGQSSRFSESVFSISPDMKKIVYVNSANQSLVVYDFKTEKEQKLYQLSEKKGSIMKFEQLYLIDDYVGFSGQYVYADNFEIAGSNAYGRINIETKKVDLYEKNETTTKFYDSYMLVVDLMRVDDNDLGTGETVIYDILNDKSTVVNLNESYNSFDIDILSNDLIVSYNDLGRNNAKLIIYQNGKNRVLENSISSLTLDIVSCYDSQKNILIVYYTIPDNEDIKGELKGVGLE